MIVHVVKAFAYWKAETGYSEVTCAALGAPGCVKHSLILPVKKTCFSFSKFGITFTASKIQITKSTKSKMDTVVSRDPKSYILHKI